MFHCRECGTTYAAEIKKCPECGSRKRAEEPHGAPNSGGDFGLKLAADALGRALGQRNFGDAEKLLGSARLEIDRRLGGGVLLDRLVLAEVAEAALLVSEAQGSAGWVEWILTVYADLGEMPPTALSRRLSTLPAAQRTSLIPSARRLIENVGIHGGPRLEDIEAYRGLTALVAEYSSV
jgi:hypothetical protein